ncbi:MAG: response regulator [Acidimicrobiales bacterium]|nr:response regulator [Acidimicrobiales bacterium]
MISLGACVLFGAWITFSFGGARATLWFDDGATALAAVTGAGLCLRASKKRPEHRAFFGLLGLALGFWAIGEGIWGFYEVVLNREVPFPSIADAGYLSAIPLAAAAMAFYPTTGRSRAATRVRSLLDALIIATSVLFVSWAFVLAPAIEQGGATPAATFVSLAYPVGDVIIASVALMALHRGQVLGRLPLLLVAFGMLANAISDSVYAYLTQVGNYASGDIIDLGWFTAYLLIGIAALAPARVPVDVETGARSVGDLVVPYVALGVAIAVAGLKIATDQMDDLMLLWLGLVAIVLVAIRQVFALADNAAALAEANEASRLKTAFIANVSHEIRTPMNGVMGMLALLLDRDLGEVERDYAETMATSAEALMAVINDVLDFSKLEAGKVQPEQAPFPLGATIEVAIAGIAGRARQKNIEVLSITQPEVPDQVIGDRLRVRQILANLLDNAVKFSASGEVVVRVGLDELGRVRFEVTDQGIGIAPEGRDVLFDSFTQADMSTTRRFGGTGLGLAICKQLAQLMGGELGVESELGVGSTFWFALPLESVGDLERPKQDSLKDARVLVVSASRAALDGLVAQVRRETPHVVGRTDAVHTLAAMFDAADQGAPFDVILVDDRIVGDSQLGLARTIASSPALMSTRVVGLAAQTTMDTSEPQIHAWVAKPVRNAVLVERLLSVGGVARKHPMESTPAPPPQPFRRARALVVEDNAVNAKVAVALLDAMGVEADLAHDGIEALEALERCSYDVVFMDVQMPRLNGYEATREIRRRGFHTPIIAMTASAAETDRIESLDAGMDDFLSKPIDRNALAEVLRTRIPNNLPTV